MVDFSKLAMLFGAVLGIAFLGVIVIILVRRHCLGSSATEASLPFTLQDLRDMLARGEITPAEFETMRSAMIGGRRAPPGASTAGHDRLKREMLDPPDSPGDEDSQSP